MMQPSLWTPLPMGAKLEQDFTESCRVTSSHLVTNQCDLVPNHCILRGQSSKDQKKDIIDFSDISHSKFGSYV